MIASLKSPYVYFGGKSKIMPLVWSYLGDVDNFVDPFVGSLASILGRPVTHQPRAETVNDLDRFICNFWRALQAVPDEVAHYADWPVNETDLTARHIWLVNEGRQSLAKLEGNPDYYDAKIAGWWVWGINAWIGSGWCSGDGCWNVNEAGEIVNVNDNGVERQLPHLGNMGQGVNRKHVHLGRGQGINRQRPALGKREEKGIFRYESKESLRDYMNQLAARLRKVRVCTGDWIRVITDGALSYGTTVGIFLDPPYSAETGRDMGLYNHETEVNAAVGKWAIENGDNRRYRIALCGYEGEYAMPDNWTEIAWKAGASYQTSNSNGKNKDNRKRERIWFSPHCVPQQELLIKV